MSREQFNRENEEAKTPRRRETRTCGSRTRRSRTRVSCSSWARRWRPSWGWRGSPSRGPDVKRCLRDLRLQGRQGSGSGLARPVRRVPQAAGGHRPARGDRVHRLILELKVPGLTVPGIIAALCFILVFWAHSQLQRPDVRAGAAAVPPGAGAGRARDLRPARFRGLRDLRYPVHAGGAGAGHAREDSRDRRPSGATSGRKVSHVPVRDDGRGGAGVHDREVPAEGALREPADAEGAERADRDGGASSCPARARRPNCSARSGRPTRRCGRPAW